MDAGGRAAPAPGGLAAFTTSLWIVTQEAKTEGLGEGAKAIRACSTRFVGIYRKS